MLIDEISLENFRVFKDKCSFQLAPITILTGANSSGKSSVIKALKLMQGFDGSVLNFSENQESAFKHQLGNAEMVFNRESEKKEFSITYKLLYHDNEIYTYWGNLIVENTFCLDESNDLKNAKLKTSSIYVEDEKKDIILLSKIDTNTDTQSFNIPEVIKKFQALHNDYVEFKEKIEPYIVTERVDDGPYVGGVIGEATINNYTGLIRFCDYEEDDDDENGCDITRYFFPEPNKQFADFMGFDFRKLQILNANNYLFEVSSETHLFDYDANMKIKEVVAKGLNFNESPMANPKILKWIAQIPIENYDNFEQNLWELMLKQTPDKLEKHSLESFLKLFDEIDEVILHNDNFLMENKPASIKTIKDFIKKNTNKDFDSFYNKMITEIHKEFDKSCSWNSNEFFKELNTISSINIGSNKLNTKNLFSILQYFYVLETLLLHPNGTLKNYCQDDECFSTLHFRYNKSNANPAENSLDLFNYFPQSNLYSFIEDAMEEVEKFTYKQIKAFHNNCYFIESYRANTHRLYTFSSQGTSFNQFLSEFLSKKPPLDFINKWIKEFEMGDSIDYQSNLLECVGTQLNIIKDGKPRNIVDLGYGVTQFLALLLRIDYAGRNKFFTIAIEEPETHLHPKLQSKLADLFLDAHDTFKINFIIETHSEYLIRSLQVLTATGQIKPEETVIHYMDNYDETKREPGEEQIRTIHIKPNGQLTKPFGTGFTDESFKWIKKLFTHSESN